MEGFGAGPRSVLVTNGSGCGSGRPKTYGSGSGFTTLLWSLNVLDIIWWDYLHSCSAYKLYDVWLKFVNDCFLLVCTSDAAILYINETRTAFVNISCTLNNCSYMMYKHCRGIKENGACQLTNTWVAASDSQWSFDDHILVSYVACVL
jgi:hypothetical protein